MAYYVMARPGVDTADTNTYNYGMANYALATDVMANCAVATYG